MHQQNLLIATETLRVLLNDLWTRYLVSRPDDWLSDFPAALAQIESAKVHWLQLQSSLEKLDNLVRSFNYIPEIVKTEKEN